MNGGGQKQHHHQLALLRRSNSYSYSTSGSSKSKKKITPSTNYLPIPENQLINTTYRFKLSSLLRTFLSFPTLIVPSCTITHHGRKVTGTLFGYRRGHVSFAVQDDPRSEPVLLLELGMTTAMLVKEMSSGLVRIALECDKSSGRVGRLFNEPMWTMYCNGRKTGYAPTWSCTESDWHVMSTIQSVSVGAGVIPASEGELLYMRARFERVVGSRDSEAFYMINPDKNGAPELTIFLLRI